MTTSLNSSTPGRDIGYWVEQVLHRTISYTDTTDTTIGGLPANAIITGGIIATTTAFSGTTPVISIGYTDATASNPSAYASAQSVGTAGTATMDEVLTSGALPLTRATKVIAAVTGTSMTAGVCEVVLRFIAQQD